MTDESNTPRKARYFRYKKMFLELTDRYKELQLQFERRPIVYIDKVVHNKEDWESLWISRELWNELNTQNTALRAELAALKEQNAGCSRALTKLMTEHRKLVEAVEEMIEMDGCIADYANILSKLLPETPEVG